MLDSSVISAEQPGLYFEGGRVLQDSLAVWNLSMIQFSERSWQSCSRSSPRTETGKYVDREGRNNREEKRNHASG
jgi:hypothetical protein